MSANCLKLIQKDSMSIYSWRLIQQMYQNCDRWIWVQGRPQFECFRLLWTVLYWWLNFHRNSAGGWSLKGELCFVLGHELQYHKLIKAAIKMISGTGLMAQWLRVQDTFQRTWVWFQHGASELCNSHSRDPIMPSCGLHRHQACTWCTDRQTGKAWA